MEEKPEVVIAGMAGTFPGCATVEDLQEALFKKSHLISNDKSHWEVCYDEDEMDWPMFTGHAVSHHKFDATFFNIPFSYPSVMDPIMKKCLEISVEAVIDAGFNPKQLEGTNTAVYVTYDNSESELILTYTITEKVLMGNCRALTANRLSFAMNLQGPSYAFQGGYGSMLHYFDHAKRQLEEGRLDGAIIVSANNIMSPRFLAIYQGMGFSAADGKCRAFDEHAQGYAVSDSCAAFFIQRARDARRNWATVIGADFRFFGDKADGNFISFHEEPVKKMLRENYEKWKIDPTTVTYIEADGCGFKEREDKEINIIAETFCKNRKSPLLVGSVKSNIGHAETAAAAAGTVKAVIALNKSEIPPSINVETPNYKLAANKMKVVTESTPLKGNLVGINAIGFAGGFGHLLLQQNVKSASSKKIEESLPQIMLMSSRTEEGIEQILQRVATTNVTPEFAALSNGVFQEPIKGHMFRGYNLKHADGTISEPKRQRVDGDKGPIWWVFSGMGSQWNGMGAQLMHIPLFRDVIDKCDEILRPRGVDIKHILTTDDETIFDNILHSFVGIAAIQIGLVEILRALEIEPEGIIGHSVGELGCAYADNCLTLEQTILAAHARGKASLEATLIKGMMAAVGLGFRDIVGMLPETIDVACQNSSTSCTISGPTEDVTKFVAELEAKGIFAKSVNVANIAYHSRYIQPAGPILLKYLKEVIPINTKRSTKWVSSSVPKTNWFTNAAKFNSPEYHTNNLLSPVLFEEAITVIPKNATLIEIAPHGLLQAILKRALPDTVANVPLTRRTKGPDPSNVKFLLDAIGKLYLLGYSPNVSLLYPPTQFPVPCDTPSLQPFVTWEHSETYKLPDYMQICGKEESIVCEKAFSIPEIKAFLRKYEEEDTPIHPISFLLVEVWKSFGAIHKKIYAETPVVFENIHIWSGLDLSKEDLCSVSISVLPVDGEFEIAQEWIGQGKNEDEEIRNMLISGRIKLWEDAADSPNSSESFEKSNDDEICQSWQADDIERYYNNSGKAKLHLKSTHIHELELCSKGLKGKILWSGDWVLNFDTILKANLLQGIKDAAQLDEPSSIQFMFISPDQTQLIEEGSLVEFCLDSSLHSFHCAGITARNFKTQPSIELAGKEIVDTERLQFIPYSETSFSVSQYSFRESNSSL
ncbi:fatty acid synthase [Bemisia tabaci]|uniref:fatty acid synthase n=1 Tax=Bemisia tabaci TaxID=7038 RepID=UPI003B2809BE